MARKADEASNFVFVQLTEQEASIYDKSHPDYARRDKVDLAWEKISHKMNESRMCVNVYIYSYIINITYNRNQIQNMSAKTMQTATTVCPMLCDTNQ
jgi:GTP cyclohydrolase FolE2